MQCGQDGEEVSGERAATQRSSSRQNSNSGNNTDPTTDSVGFTEEEIRTTGEWKQTSMRDYYHVNKEGENSVSTTGSDGRVIEWAWINNREYPNGQKTFKRVDTADGFVYKRARVYKDGSHEVLEEEATEEETAKINRCVARS